MPAQVSVAAPSSSLQKSARSCRLMRRLPTKMPDGTLVVGMAPTLTMKFPRANPELVKMYFGDSSSIDTPPSPPSPLPAPPEKYIRPDCCNSKAQADFEWKDHPAMNMSVPERNAWFLEHSTPKSDILKIRMAIRRRNNRLYAQKARLKRQLSSIPPSIPLMPSL